MFQNSRSRGNLRMSPVFFFAGMVLIVVAGYKIVAVNGIIENGLVVPATVVGDEDSRQVTMTGQPKKRIFLTFRDNRGTQHNISRVVTVGEARNFIKGSKHKVVFDPKNPNSYKFGERPEDFNTQKEIMLGVLGASMVFLAVFVFGYTSKG